MKKMGHRFSNTVIASLLLTLGAFGAAHAASSTHNHASSSQSAMPVGSDESMPTGSSSSSSVTAPSPPAAPAAPTPPVAAATSTLTVGELTLSHMRASYKHDHIDVYLSIKNASTADEKIGGADAGTLSSSVVQVTKDKSGKEEEGPLSAVLPANKLTDFSSDGTWLRIKDVKSEPKANSLVPLTLYFRRSPNAVLKISLSAERDEGSSGLMDWFKK